MTFHRKTLVRLLVAAMVMAPFQSFAADYQYFRMYGGGSAVVGGGVIVPPPASNLSYTVSGLGIGTVGQSYAATSSVVGATGAVVFSLSSGFLPTGLSLNPNSGAIAGVASVAGSFNSILKATDSTGAIGLASLQVKISPVFSVSGNPGLVGTTGASYSAAFGGVGGSAPYSFSTSSSLPPGISLSGAGLLSGTPSASGSFPGISIVGLDHDGRASTFAPFNLTIYDPVQVSWAPPAGTAGTFYTTVPSASGGHTPYNFSLTGIAPAGLSFNASNGTLSGTPTNSGDFTLTIVAHDFDSRSATTGPTTITIAPGVTPPATLTISGTPGTGQVGVGYLATFTSTGGSGGNVYTLDSGTLPAGLSLSASGVISGTPSVAGTTSGLKVRVTDQVSATALSGAFSIVVAPQPALQISGSPATTARVGDAYTTTFNGIDGAGYGYTFSSVGSALPPGLSLADANGTSGIISGTPTHIGTYSGIKIRVTDGQGHTADSNTFSISVGIISGPALAVSGTPSAYGDVGASYNAAFSATGGTGAGYLFDISAGGLPTGLSLSPGGSISGTLTAAGSYSFTVRVVDSSGDSATTTAAVSVASPFDLSVPALTDGTWGSFYTYTVFASGGRTPYHFDLTGSLAPGLSLNPTSGTVSGTPVGSGIQAFTLSITATDADGRTVAKNANMTVYPPVSFAVYSPPAGFLGESYSYTPPAATGGSGQFTYQATNYPAATPSSALSDIGLNFDEATGTISGVPTSSGTTAQFSILAVDTVRGTHNVVAPVTLFIGPALHVSGTPATAAVVGTAYSSTFSASGGSQPHSFAIASGLLPSWLHLDSSTGVLSGTPAVGDIGTVGPLAVRVVNAGGGSSTSSAFSIVVSNPLIFSGTPSTATQGNSYSFDLKTLTAGGATPLSYSIASGSLPAGLSLASNGVVSGSEVTGASATVGITVSDAGSQTTTQALVFTVDAATATSSITSPSKVHKNQTVSGLLSSNLSSPTWSFSSSPAGLSLSGSGSSFSGSSPSVASETVYTVTATATQGSTSVASATFQVTVEPDMILSGGPSAIVSGEVGAALSATPAVIAANNLGSVSYALIQSGAPIAISSVCPGLSFSTSNGSISGTPTTNCAAASGLSIRGTDTDGTTASTSAFALSIINGPSAPTGNFTTSAVVGNSYSSSGMSAVGGTSPYAWSVASGSLPTGLNLASSGTLSGTPSAGGTFTFTVKVTDSLNVVSSASATQTITVVSAPSAPTGTLVSSGVAGVAFDSGALTPNGGVGPYTWQITTVSGAIPPGLAFFASSGKITGTPTDVGSFTFTLKSVDASSAVSPASAQQSLAVTRTPSTSGNYSPSTAPAGDVLSVPHPGISGGPGTPPYTYQVSAGSLPPGLSINASNGIISGVPTTPGVYGGISILLTDANGYVSGNSGTVQSFTITTPSVVATLTTPSTVRVGAPIAGTLTTSISSVTGWSFTQNSPASPSLALTSAAPSASTTFSATAPSVSSSTPFSFTPRAISGAYSQAANAVAVTVAPTLVVSGGPSNLTGTANAAFTWTSAVSFGTTAIGSPTLALRQGGATINIATICPGLAFNTSTGVISGSPTGACSPTGLTLMATDSDGATASTAPFSITIAPQTSISGSFTTTAANGSAYSSGPLSAAGGTAPYSNWTVASGSLPAGLSLSASTGILSGTPTATASYSFTVTVTDAGGHVSTPSATQTVTVSGPVGLSISGTPDPLLSGVPYSWTPTVSGGTAPYTFTYTTTSATTLTSLNLGISTTTGAIFGENQYSGATTKTWTGTVSVKDSVGAVSSMSASVSIAPGAYIYYGNVSAPCNASDTGLRIVCPVGTATAGIQISSLGPLQPTSYAILSGALPTGLSLNSSTGAITGTPSVAGSYSVTVQGTNGTNKPTTSVVFVITTTTSVAITDPTILNYSAAVGEGFATNGVVVGGGTGALTVTAVPALPYDWTLLFASGRYFIYSPSPMTAVSWTGVLKVTDGGGRTAQTSPININVAAALAISGTPTAGVIGAAYSWTPTVTGGTPVVSYALATSGSTTLAALGLAFDTVTGKITGTPTTGGTWQGTISVTDAGTVPAFSTGKTVTSTPLILNVPGAALSISGTMPTAVSGAQYSWTPTITGGTAPFTVSYRNLTGTDPSLANLKFDNTTGRFFGGVQAAGSGTTSPYWTGTMTVIDNVGNSATTSVSLAVTLGSYFYAYNPTVCSGALDGFVCTVNTAIPNSPSGFVPIASGTISSYSLLSGALPAGLSLGTSNGFIFGTPTTTGLYSFVVRGIGTAGNSDVAVTMKIAGPSNLQISNVLASYGQQEWEVGTNGAANGRYSYGYGGTTPYTFTAVPALPAGLSLTINSGTQAVVSGTPTVAAKWTGVIRVTDSASRTADTDPFSLTVYAKPTISDAPPIGAKGAAYSWTPRITGGRPAFKTFSVNNTSGTLAALNLAINANTGAITGTPSAFGTWTGTISFCDAFACQTSGSLTISVPVLSITGTPTSGTAGTAYSWTPTTIGGTPSYTFSLTNTGSTVLSQLGLAISASTGAITGTPQNGGSAPITITVTDQAGATSSISVTVTIAGTSNPVVSGSAVTPFAANATYQTTTYTATGGTVPYTWSKTGTLPPGLTLASDGTLSGTPTTTGSYSFNVVASGGGFSGSLAQTIVISNTVFSVSSRNGLSDARTIVNSPGAAMPGYSSTATNATGTVVWSLGGAAGSGITIDQTGTLGGTITSNYGVYHLTVTGTDSAAHTSSYSFYFDLYHSESDGGNSAILKVNGTQFGSSSSVGSLTWTGSSGSVGQTFDVVYSTPVLASYVPLTVSDTGSGTIVIDVYSSVDGVSYTSCVSLSLVGANTNLNSNNQTCGAGFPISAKYFKWVVSSITGGMALTKFSVGNGNIFY